jgi:hypothetical protein
MSTMAASWATLSPVSAVWNWTRIARFTQLFLPLDMWTCRPRCREHEVDADFACVDILTVHVHLG